MEESPQSIQKAAIYARSATKQEFGTECALASQIQGCTRYAFEHGYKVELVLEEIWSGLDIKRPMLKQLLDGASRRTFTVLLVTRLNRLSRDLSQVSRLINLFQEVGVRVECVEKNFTEIGFFEMISSLASKSENRAYS